MADERPATRYALGRAEAKWGAEVGTAAAAFRGGVTLDEIRRAAANLDRTFLVRLFAEFEGIMLGYWQDGLGRTTKPEGSGLPARRADFSAGDVCSASRINRPTCGELISRCRSPEAPRRRLASACASG